ncbi:MAG: hypothetical protein R3E31_05990 [Chloroflexota bacterium]
METIFLAQESDLVRPALPLIWWLAQSVPFLALGYALYFYRQVMKRVKAMPT